MLRKGYSTKFHIYRDSNETVIGTYYLCDPSKVLPFPTFLGSHQWDRDHVPWDDPLGEVYGAFKDIYKPSTPPPGTPTTTVGTAKQFLYGISVHDCHCLKGEAQIGFRASWRVIAAAEAHGF